MYHTKKVSIIMAEETLQGVPNSHSSLEVPLATKCVWMNIQYGLGNIILSMAFAPNTIPPCCRIVAAPREAVNSSVKWQRFSRDPV